MAEGSLIGSLARIEAALDRMEAQASRLGTPTPSERAETELQQRHQQLQASVATALGRIDAVLAGQSEEPQ